MVCIYEIQGVSSILHIDPVYSMINKRVWFVFVRYKEYLVYYI